MDPILDQVSRLKGSAKYNRDFKRYQSALDDVLRAIDLLRPEFSEQTWQAFWRTAVEGQPAVEAAQELGMSPGAVRVAKCRVLHRLRADLAALSEG